MKSNIDKTKTIDEVLSMEYLADNLKNELCCAVAISEKYEYFALADSVTHDFISIGRCDIGNSLGELIAVHEYKVDDPIEWISIYLEDLVDRVKNYSVKDVKELIEDMFNQYLMTCNPSRDIGLELKPYLNLMLSHCFADLINLGLKYLTACETGCNIADLTEYSIVKRDIKELKATKVLANDIMQNLLKQDQKHFEISEGITFNLSYNGVCSIDYKLNDECKIRFPDDDTLHNWFIPKSSSSLINYVISFYSSHNFHFRECNYCGRFFALTDGYKAKYCKRNIEDLGYGKTCRANGQAIAQGKKVMADPVKGAYTKAYQAHYVRVKRNIMTNDAFVAWNNEAKAMRDKCLQGLISLQELIDWLNQDKLRSTAN